MASRSTLLSEVLDLIRKESHSAASLTLYAMIMTMNHEEAGCLFKLNKLRDLDTAERQLAYDLMELMVEEGNHGDAWEAALAEMDAIIKNG